MLAMDDTSGSILTVAVIRCMLPRRQQIGPFVSREYTPFACTSESADNPEGLYCCLNKTR